MPGHGWGADHFDMEITLLMVRQKKIFCFLLSGLVSWLQFVYCPLKFLLVLYFNIQIGITAAAELGATISHLTRHAFFWEDLLFGFGSNNHKRVMGKIARTFEKERS